MEGVIFDNTFQEEIYRLPNKTTVIISSPWSEIAGKEKELLEKILGAVGLSLAAVRIVRQQEPNLEQLSPIPEKVLAFCGPVKGVTLHEVISASGIEVIFSDHLENLQQDDEAKRRLWQALKQLFGR